MATIKKRKWSNKSGTHEAWVLNYMGSDGKRCREQFELKRDADARRVQVEGQINNGSYRPDANTTTVKQMCDEYIKVLEARNERNERVVQAYLVGERGHINNYISPREASKTGFVDGIGNMKLGKLTPRGVGKFRDDLRNAGVSIMNTRAILGTLGRVLKHAIGQDIIVVNAAAGTKVIGTRTEGAKKVYPPSKADITAFIAACSEDFKVRVVFSAATGLRVSEMLALRWKHVDLKTGEVSVERAVDRYGNEDTTKSLAGIRTVPMGDTVTALLRAWKLRAKYSKDGDLVFPNTVGRYQSYRNLRERLFKPTAARVREEMKKRGQQFKPFTWHALRHFAISTWIEAGFPPKTVQTFAGHSSLAVTMDRYGHLFRSEDHKIIMDAIAAKLFPNGA